MKPKNIQYFYAALTRPMNPNIEERRKLIRKIDYLESGMGVMNMFDFNAFMSKYALDLRFLKL